MASDCEGGGFGDGLVEPGVLVAEVAQGGGHRGVLVTGVGEIFLSLMGSKRRCLSLASQHICWFSRRKRYSKGSEELRIISNWITKARYFPKHS